MTWIRRDNATGVISQAEAEKAQRYEEDKNAALPTIRKESESTMPFEPVRFQPVKSTEYEAEFGVKGDDVLFHFWPPGYHQADAIGQRTPTFRKDFEDKLGFCLSKEVPRHQLKLDEDVGAVFVICPGLALNLSHRQLCIRVCEKLHYELGGK